MGRPKKDEAEKKMQLNIRVKPTTKVEIETHAKREGCTVSAKAEQLIEAMLDLSDDADQETIELLSDIVQEIQNVQSLTGGKWHSDLKTWAAVTEIFKGSPIKQRKPKDEDNDPAVRTAWDAFIEIVREKQDLIVAMQRLGVSINRDAKPRHNTLSGRGLFGRTIPNFREMERSKISEIKDDSERNKAEVLFGMITEMDEQEDEALKVWIEASAPYRELEITGAALYRDKRHQSALEKLRKGGTPDIEDL